MGNVLYFIRKQLFIFKARKHIKYAMCFMLSLFSSTMAIAQSAAPITGNLIICAGSSTVLNDTITGGTWSSSDITIAVVDSVSGIMRGVSSGTTTITYSASSGFATATVTVNPSPAPISGLANVCAGATTILNSTTSGGTWTSNNTAIACVDSVTGRVRGVSAGSAVITYKLPTGCITTTAETINPLPPAIAGNNTICLGSTTVLTESVSGTWSSSGSAGIATVSAGTYRVTGVSTGTVNITYILGSGCTTTSAVTVISSPLPITGNTNVCVGAATTLNDAGGGTWSSSNTAIATVNSATGIVTGVAPGIANIIYTLPCGSAVVAVTVRPPSAPPAVNSLSPASGRPSSTIAITGTNFNPVPGDNIVYIGAAKATVAAASSTSLTVNVPTGSTYMPVSVNNTGCGLSAYSQYPFLPTYDNSLYPAGTINFDNKSDFTTGNNPMSIAISDFDGDGKPDMAVLNINDNTVSIYRNTSSAGTINAGSFATKVDFATGSQPYSITIGDIDGDGKPDMVVTNKNDNTVSVLRNLAAAGSITSGSFAGKIDFATGINPISAAIGDIDGDGKLDIVTANYFSNTLSVLRNRAPNGCITSASFAPKVDFTTGAQPYNVAISDIDGDGKPDVAVVNQASATLSIFRNTAVTGSITNTSLAPRTDFATGNNPFSIAIGDIDGDGKVDLAVVNHLSYTLSIFHNTSVAGSVTLAGKVDFATGILPFNLAMGDLDGDGKPDIAVANQGIDRTPGSTAISVFRNKSVAGLIDDSSIAAKVNFVLSSSPRFVAVGDIDGDGKPELLVSKLSENIVSIIRNNPLLPITGITNICGTGSTTLSDAVTGGIWKSNDTTVATVDTATGIVTGVATGTSVISYTVSGGTVTTTVTVTTLAATTGTTDICIGATTTLSNASAGGTWSSSNVATAIIGSGTGIVTGITSGTAIITYAVSSGCATTSIVTVNPPAIAGVTTICTGTTTTLSDAAAGGTWSSPDGTGIVTVGTGTGMIAGVATGTATIIYTAPAGCIATTTLKVISLPTPITGASDVCDGSATTLNNTTSGGSWSSSDASIVSIGSTTGIATGISAGTATITYLFVTGCSTTTTITANPSPSAITGTGIVCMGLTTTLSDPTMGGSWSSGNMTIATVTASTGVVTGVSAGTAPVSYTSPAGCTTTMPVTVNDVPSAITGATAICTGSAAALGNSVAGGVWSSNNVSVATINGSTGVVTGIATGTSIITYALATGCLITTPVTVNPLPASITGVPNVCIGSTTTLSNTTSGGTWSSGNTNASVGSATGIATGMSAGTSMITYTAGTGCIATTPVTVNPLPASITGSPNICIGSTTVLNNITPGGTWSSSSTNASIGSGTGLVTGVSAGTSMITYTLGTGCITTTVATVNPLPSSITGAPDVCIGATTALNDATPGGTWSSSSSNVAIGSATGIATGINAGTATITYATASGCITTSPITVNPLPTPITGATNVCTGATAALNNTTTGGVWNCSSTAIATINAGTGIVTGISAGTAIVTYAISTGCSTTATITVDPLPAAITGTTSICQGALTTLNNATTGGTWSSNDTSVATADPGTGIVTSVASGTAIITYTAGSGCLTTAVVTVNPLPASITGTRTICQGSATALSDATAGGTWSSGSSSIASVGLGTGIVTGIAAGTTTITYRTATGCTATSEVTVNPLPSAISGTTHVCIGSSVTLLDATTGGMWSNNNSNITVDSAIGIVTGITTGTSIITYTLGTGCTANITVTVNPQPAAISGSTSVCAGTATPLSDIGGGTWSSSNANVSVGAATGIATGVTAGTATITYTLGTGCTTNVTVTVNPLPSAITGTSAVCNGSTTTLSDAAGGGTWSSNNPTIASIGSGTGNVTGIAPGSATITYSSGAGCNATTIVTVSPLPSAISGNNVVSKGLTTVLTDSISGGTWASNNTSVATIGSISGMVTGTSAGTAAITYTLAAGCSATTSLTVTAFSGATTICTGFTSTLSYYITGGTWSSGNTAVATIGSGTGIVTGVAAGTSTITYRVGAITETAVVTVIASPGAPAVTSLSASVGIPLSAVTISGTNFNTTPGSNIVYFGATKATVSSGSGTSLDVSVPVGATYMPVTVNNSACGLVGYSQYPFLPRYDNSAFPAGVVTFATKTDFTSGTNPLSIAIGDIDGDGKPDMIATNIGSNTISVYRNTATSGSVNAGSFAAKVDFATGNQPYSVAVGDLNGDGKLDLVVGNYASNTVSVFKNTAIAGTISASSFAAKVDFATGTNPISVTIGDLDKDGKPELVTANFYSGTVSVLRNLIASGSISGASFAAKVDFAAGTHPYCVALGDIDGDGKREMVVANQGSASVSVFRNTATPGSVTSASFAAKVNFATGTNPYSVAIGDIDGDGKMDLAIANYTSNTVSVLRNTSVSGAITAASFASKIDFTTGTSPYGVSMGDIDGDGKVDLAVVNSGSATVSVFRNTATSGAITGGSLATKVDMITGSSPRSLAIGDMDGDTRPDIVVANLTANTVSVIRNNPSLQPPTITSVSPPNAAPGTSVTITGTNFNTTSANNIVYFGATRATVSMASATTLNVTVPVSATFMPVSVTDAATSLNANSRYPFLPTYNNSAYLSGTVNFSPKVDFAVGTNPYSVAIGDLDGDGKPDVAVVNNGANSVSVFRNTSVSGTIAAGSFAPKVDFATGAQPYSIAIADINGDGKPDMVTANLAANTVSVLRNTATSGSIASGSFAAKVDFATGSNPISVAVSDLNGDGKPDIAVANWASGSMSVLRNASTGSVITTASFAAKVDFVSGTHPQSIATGDIDGDGKPDIIVANQGSTNVSVFRNTVAGGSITSTSFAPKVNFTTGTNPYSIAIGDIDGDGKLDIAVANNGSNTVSVFRNTATTGSITSSSLALKVDYATGTTPYNVSIGDINGDGKPDLAVANSASATVSIIRNTSVSGSITSGSFAAKVDFTTGTSPRFVAIADLDGDSKPDLAVANLLSNTVSIIRNNPILPVAGTMNICKNATTSLNDATGGGTWSSSNTSVATVGSGTGIVTGVAAGTAAISYNLPGGKAITVVTVNPLPNAGMISGVMNTIVGGNTTLASSISGGTWNSGNTFVANIGSASGIVSGVGTGTTIITYTVSNASLCSSEATATVTVYPAPSGKAADTASAGLRVIDDMKIFPNPNSGFFVIRGSLKTTTDEEVFVEIINMFGQVVYNNNFLTKNGIINEQIRITAVANGTYILKLHSGGEKWSIYIAIKQ
jgi:trimeric autotransporter adhesin